MPTTPVSTDGAPRAPAPRGGAAPAPSLYDCADLYDHVVHPGPCEPFYREVAREAAARAGAGRTTILEVACGTGRLTLPLARDGHDVTGLDASPAMLARARAKARAAKLKPAFVQADMRSFRLGREVELAIVACNSLAHLVETGDLRACLRTLREHLAPGGLLAFDVVNPDLRALAAPQRLRLDRGPNPSSGIAIEEQATFDPIRQVRTALWRVRDPHWPVEVMAPLQLRVIFPQELALLLEAEGFEVVARYGDFARNPLSPASLNQIYVARSTSARGRSHA
jgi:SAM-dependent methyltransferase